MTNKWVTGVVECKGLGVHRDLGVGDLVDLVDCTVAADNPGVEADTAPALVDKARAQVDTAPLQVVVGHRRLAELVQASKRLVFLLVGLVALPRLLLVHF